MEKNNEIHFGRLLQKLLESQTDTLGEVAKKLGYSNPKALYPIFKKADLSTAVLKKACQLYDADMGYFFSNGYLSVNQVRSFKDNDPVYSATAKALEENRIAVLESDKKGLEEQVKLLREMVEILKSRDK